MSLSVEFKPDRVSIASFPGRMSLCATLLKGESLTSTPDGPAPFLLFITHDIALASDLCDRIVVSYAGEHVEQGTSERVLLEPKHPYTQGLLASTPLLYGSHPPEFLSGTPPDLISPPTGCRFKGRCQYALPKCGDETPSEIHLSGEQKVRCWLYE